MGEAGRRILIVDDQPGIRLLLSEVLVNKGYIISMAENGEQALNKIAQEYFDLIILDYHLPIINGEEVLQQLSSDNFKKPVIIITGLVESLTDKVEKHTFPIEILAKPFDIEALCQMAKKIMTQAEGSRS